MQIKINGEQPFQVLGTNFTIGPSSSGYDLMFSADGLSYSKLFTVGANTNRQVTQVAAGSYYFLSGNTDSGVTVNWMKDCGGGGGGSYVLPTASSDTLGGVKIGSGITIDANGVISSEGGEAFKVTVSTHQAADWTSDDYSALTEMVEYLSGRTEMVEAYIDAVSMDGSDLSGGERFTLSYMERESAVFSFPDYPSNLLYSIYLNFEDVESSESYSTTIPEEGRKTAIVIEEHYEWEGQAVWEEWLPIYNNLAETAEEMGIEEFSKNYEVYLRRTVDGGEETLNTVGYGLISGEDDGEPSTWLTFWALQGDNSINRWLVSTGTRGIGAISGFNLGNVPEAKSAYIAISDSAGTVDSFNIEMVDGYLCQFSDHNMESFAFSMYLLYTPGDSERYRGNLVNFEKSYSGVSGDFFFRFIISIEGTEYEAEYYYDSANSQMVKIVFQPYKTYLQAILNS